MNKLKLTVDGNDFHLGYSRISQFLDCPRRYKYTYIDGLSGKPGIPLRKGQAYHGVLERLLRYKIKHPEGSPKWVKVLKVVEEESLKNNLEGKEISSVIEAVDFYLRELYDKHKPLEVEKDFSIVKAGIKLTGRIDLVETSGWVIDHKFSADTWADDRAKYGCQPVIYQWAVEEQLGQELGITYQGFAYNIIRTFPHPLIQLIKIPPVTQEDSLWWEEQLVLLADCIRKGLFIAKPSEKQCGYCEHKAVCKPVVYKTRQEKIQFNDMVNEVDE